MRPILLASLLALALPLAACGGGSPEPGGDVVGSWREMSYEDPPPPVDQLAVLTFADDGSYHDKDSSEVGTFTVDGGEISLVDGTNTATTQYYADGSRLLFGLLAPDDDGADPVATWTGYFLNNGTRTDTTATLKDDATVRFEQVTGTMPADTYDGTWTQTGDFVELTFEVDDGQGGTITLHLHSALYAGFIGGMYEKI